LVNVSPRSADRFAWLIILLKHPPVPTQHGWKLDLTNGRGFGLDHFFHRFGLGRWPNLFDRLGDGRRFGEVRPRRLTEGYRRLVRPLPRWFRLKSWFRTR